jgi:dCTP deaminase
MTLLSNTDILRHMQSGAVVIEPFNARSLNNVSYDLTLGDTVMRYKPDAGVVDLSVDDPAEMFVPHRALRVGNAKPAHLLCSGERVLAHSREIAGGRQVTCQVCAGTGKEHHVFPPAAGVCPACKGRKVVAVTTHLQATSTCARIGLSVCQCAGWGDVGYVSPWTLEVQNHSPRDLWIPVGAVLAQVCFHEVEPIIDGTSYEQGGGYQQSANVDVIRATWTPAKMLPKKLKVRT